MIYTVTFNPSLDYIVSVDDFTCGIVNRTTDEIIFPGGKGINVSMVLKNLGFENTALGFLAGFTGKRIQELLEEKGVRTDFISVEKGISRINVKLRSREETEINGQGPAIAAQKVFRAEKRHGIGHKQPDLHAGVHGAQCPFRTDARSTASFAGAASRTACAFRSVCASSTGVPLLGCGRICRGFFHVASIPQSPHRHGRHPSPIGQTPVSARVLCRGAKEGAPMLKGRLLSIPSSHPAGSC